MCEIMLVMHQVFNPFTWWLLHLEITSTMWNCKMTSSTTECEANVKYYHLDGV